MKTTFWNNLLDCIDEAVTDIKEQKMDIIRDIYSLSDSTEEELIEIASVIYQLDEFMLQNMLDFLTEIELYQENKSDTTEAYNRARARALERFRQEIMKIPFSMDKRGTLQFYYSILEFCDFNYHGIISLIRTPEESRIAPLYTNLSLSPATTAQTDFIVPSTSENFSGVEEVTYDTLDRFLSETQEFTKLDEITETGFPTLDMVSVLDVLAYRKIVLIGLLINNNTARYFSTGDFISDSYPGAPTFPEDLGRYYLSFINLNKRATDILIFGPMLALNIVENQTAVDAPVSDGRMRVTRNITTLGNYTDSYVMKYSDDDGVFYEEKILNESYTSGDEETLVVLAFCQGEYCRHYVEVTPDSVSLPRSYTMQIPKSEWTMDLIIRLFSLTGESEERQILFYRDVYGEIIERSSNMEDVPIEVEIDDTSDDSNVILTFRDPDNNPLPLGLTNGVYMSQKLHTKIKKIELFGRNVAEEETSIVTIEFLKNTQIEVCKCITLTTYLSIHF